MCDWCKVVKVSTRPSNVRNRTHLSSNWGTPCHPGSSTGWHYFPGYWVKQVSSNSFQEIPGEISRLISGQIGLLAGVSHSRRAGVTKTLDLCEIKKFSYTTTTTKTFGRVFIIVE